MVLWAIFIIYNIFKKILKFEKIEKGLLSSPGSLFFLSLEKNKGF